MSSKIIERAEKQKNQVESQKSLWKVKAKLFYQELLKEEETDMTFKNQMESENNFEKWIKKSWHVSTAMQWFCICICIYLTYHTREYS